MNSKQRIMASLEGKPVDRMPVTVPYIELYHQDHFSELTGKAFWEVYRWHYAEPAEYLSIYRDMIDKVPFDIMEPSGASCRHIEFVRKNGHMCLYDRRTDTYQPIDHKLSGEHPFDYTANETQRVFCREDVRKQVPIVKAETRPANVEGRDHTKAVVREFGKDNFIAAHMTGILWNCHWHLGQTNMLCMLIDNPDLVRCLSDRLLENTIESIRAGCAVGYDGFFIDDAMAYSDMISVRHYEQFSLPYLKAMVDEIHRLGRKAILIYFGGVSDRLEQIVATGADGLLVEASMKNYVNDIVHIAEKIGKRITLFGNIDPIGILENGTDEQLEAEVQRQALAAKKSRGFVMSTGSPITPKTSLSRVQKFIKLGNQ